jgi:hypothetical protein
VAPGSFLATRAGAHASVSRVQGRALRVHILAEGVSLAETGGFGDDRPPVPRGTASSLLPELRPSDPSRTSRKQDPSRMGTPARDPELRNVLVRRVPHLDPRSHVPPSLEMPGVRLRCATHTRLERGARHGVHGCLPRRRIPELLSVGLAPPGAKSDPLDRITFAEAPLLRLWNAWGKLPRRCGRVG